MQLIPVLFGIIFGLALGAIFTDMRREDLTSELKLFSARIRTFLLNERGSSGKSRRSLKSFFRALRPTLRFQCIIVLFILYCSGFYFYSPSFSRQDYFVGLLIGFAAAPWAWLHFARDLAVVEVEHENEGAEQEKAKSKESLKSGNERRYEFLTIALGAIFVAAILGPRFSDWLPRANKVDVLGFFSVSLSDRGSPVHISNATQNSQGANLARDRLSSDTRYAANIGNSSVQRLELNNIGSDLSHFSDLPAIDRDRIYIAYFVNSAEWAINPSHREYATSLQQYLEKAERTGLITWDQNDYDLVRNTRSLFACFQDYAEVVGDIHLYFLDVSSVLRALASNLAYENGGRTVYKELAEASKDPVKRMVAAIIKAKNSTEESQCSKALDELPRADAGNSSSRLGATPYPAILTAYSLAAVDSPDAGIIYLVDWVKKKELLLHSDPSDAQAQGVSAELVFQWYLIRAELELGFLATAITPPLVSKNRLVSFERQLTDKFGALLGVNSPQRWKDFCRKDEFGGLHRKIGLLLAYNYAIARNYLFELQTPDAIQIWQESKEPMLEGHLQDDLAEAVAISQSTDCLLNVESFHKDRWHWLGQFELNVAQLRLAKLPIIPENQRATEQSQINKLLETAEAHLNSPPPPIMAGREVDGLLGVVPFEDQRLRVGALKSLLAQVSQLR